MIDRDPKPSRAVTYRLDGSMAGKFFAALVGVPDVPEPRVRLYPDPAHRPSPPEHE